MCKCEKDNPDLCFEDSVICENYLQYIATDMDRSFARTIGEIEYQYWGFKHNKIGKKYNIVELLKLIFTKNPKISGDILISKLCSNYIARLIVEMKLYIYSEKNKRKKRIRKQNYVKNGIPFKYIHNKISDKIIKDNEILIGGG